MLNRGLDRCKDGRHARLANSHPDAPCQRRGGIHPWLRGTTVFFGLSLMAIAGCPRQVNAPPIASAGGDKAVEAGAAVTLDGSASADPEGKALTYSWHQTAGAPVEISSPSEPTIVFTAPSVGTRLAFELAVSDGTNSSSDVANVNVNVIETSAQVEEQRQRSVTDDPAFRGEFPNDWTIPDAGAGLDVATNDEDEQQEFEDRFRNATSPGLLEDDLAPGQSRAMEIPIAGASGLAASARWIGTSEPLELTLLLDGNSLATGELYQMGPTRGGAYAQTQTDTGGLVSAVLKNTTDITVRIRLVFITHPMK